MGVNDYIHVGQRIKKARLSRGLSQKEMAALMELPVSTYANYEADRREMSTGLISTAALLLDISLADLMGCQYSGVDPRKMIDEYHLEIALSGRKKLGYGPYTKFSSSSAPELELTEQQEEFIKLSKNLSEAQIERILAYAQAIYDLQRNKQPSTVLDREGRRIDYSISAPVSKVAEESIGYNCNDPDEGHNREGYQRKGLLKERAKGTEILEP